MTIGELKNLARWAFDDAVARLRKSRELRQMFHFSTRDGTREMLVMDGSFTNSENAKAALAKQIRARVEKGEIVAVIHVSDIVFAENMTPANDALRREMRMTIEEAAAFGLCEKREAIMCLLQSPIYSQIMTQEYRRDGNRIELVGEPRIDDDATGGMKLMPSRFGNLFAAQSRTA